MICLLSTFTENQSHNSLANCIANLQNKQDAAIIDLQVSLSLLFPLVLARPLFSSLLSFVMSWPWGKESVGCIFRQRSSSRSFLICVMKDMFLSGHHLKCCDCCLACHSYKAVTIVWQAVFKSQSACEMLESLWTTASFSLLRRMEKKELSCLIRNEWMADLLLAKGPKGKKQLTASKLLPWVW